MIIDFKKSIRGRLVILFLVLGIVPMGLLMMAAYRGLNKEGEGRREEFRSIAEGVMEKIERCLFERYGDAQAFAANEVILDRGNWYKEGEKENKVVQAANKYVQLYGMYYLSMVVDMEGKVVGVNNRSVEGKLLGDEELYKENFGNEEWFKAVRDGRYMKGEGVDGTYVSDVGRDEKVVKYYGGNGLTMKFAAPVKDGEGKVVGVWCNWFMYSQLERIFPETYKNLKVQGYESTRMTLVNGNGVVIGDYNPSVKGVGQELVLSENVKEKGVSGVKESLEGKSGYGVYKDKERGEWVTSGYSGVQRALGFPGLGWGVLVRVDDEEVMRTVSRTKWEVGVVFLIGLVGLVIAAFKTAGGVARPIMGIVDVFERVSEGDLRGEARVRNEDEIGVLGAAANRTISNLRGIMRELKRNAGNLKESSSGMVETSQSIGRALHEMSLAITEVSRNCTQGFEIAEKANGRTKEMLEEMVRLGDAAKEIGVVVDLISGIAGQTNLLALNATIEAARAGEAGRGFEVVANEVKELAGQSGNAAKEITEKIGRVQEKAEGSIKTIEELVKIIDEVSRVSGSIAAAVEEQSATVAQIAKTMGAGEEGGDGAIKENAEVLSKMAGELGEIVGRFRS